MTALILAMNNKLNLLIEQETDEEEGKQMKFMRIILILANLKPVYNNESIWKLLQDDLAIAMSFVITIL